LLDIVNDSKEEEPVKASPIYTERMEDLNGSKERYNVKRNGIDQASLSQAGLDM
jgi:hypothetical protein